ncbi:hypothetical protein QT381_15620 [Galbitalea sp. SE-J8]|uniref:hypothetical protein n=1 Tax=Galbitalea sp. SE-J8 TaxID=3054952 RepID=UPI00259CC36D|nr:hypothetical protein [Galbitalea sp. SE-J8]MDM4764425.1 hypothetical protein [Galbitalea sp. SE-J8]
MKRSDSGGSRALGAVVVLIGLEIALVALLTAVGVKGAPAVVIVVVFALVERVAYVLWIKQGRPS